MKYYLLLLFYLISFTFLEAQPQNDECTTAIDLGVIPNCETTIYSNINASASNIGLNNIPACFNGGAISRDVWFRFTIPVDGNSRNFKITLAASVINGLLNPQLAIYRGGCLDNQLSELGVCASANITENNLEIEAIGLKPNTQYFLRVNDYSESAAPNWGGFTICIEELPPFFIMGTTEGTGLCAGTLFDSGGNDNSYQNNEANLFTVCPTAFHRCIEIVVTSYDIEREYDFLRIYEGENATGKLLTVIDGKGHLSLANANSDCFTVQFTSDASQTRTGFRLNWQCVVEKCPEIPETTCDNPVFIDNIPFEANGLTTCFAGNNLEIGPCGEDEFLNGQEYIFAYESLGGECIAINIEGVVSETGISIFRGCPESGDAFCINQKQGTDDESTVFLPNVSLDEKGIYYFVIVHENNCTPFDISITTSSTCPSVFPSAADCQKGLILNGCNPELPAALTVELGSGSPNFFQLGINNGCWDDVFETNYTWFTFEAQGAGEFAFLLSNNDPDDVVDIDFNIWGPFNNLADACFGADNTQPIRSSWADDLIYSVTGLANTNPELGTPVTATCEDAFGEGFVKPLKVKKGEVYVVLINDFDGVIFNGAIAIDFRGSDPNVLKSIPGHISTLQDTFICAGNSITLLAEGASAYEWSPSESLSCRNCPNPIASPTETTTYIVNASTVCKTESKEITVGVINMNAGSDQTVCQGAIIELNANTDANQVNYQWSSPNGTASLSCADCPNPTFIASELGVFEYIIEIGRATCLARDTLLLTVIEGESPIYEIADNQQVCMGAAIELGGQRFGGQIYEWINKEGSFVTNEANPIVSPVTSTTYFLQITADGCSIETIDSVEIEVNTTPYLNLQKDTTICQSTSILLGNSVIENGVNYQWTTSDLMTIDNPFAANSFVSPENTAIYRLTATNGACSISDSVLIEVIPSEVRFENQADFIALCLGESLNINLSVLPENIIPQITTGSFNTNSLKLFLNPAINQTYIAQIETNGCQAADTLVVMVDSLPKNMEILPTDTTVCIGTPLVLQSPIYEPVLYPNIQHQWMPFIGFETPDSFYNLVIIATDSIELKRVNTNGVCADTSVAIINVLPFLEVPIHPTDTIICLEEMVQLIAELPENAENIAWTPTENISCTNCLNPIVAPIINTIYTLTGTLNNCPLMGSASIGIVDFSGTYLINEGESEIYIGQRLDSIILMSNLNNIASIEWRENGILIEGANDTILNYIPLANEPITQENRTVLIEVIIETEEGCRYIDEITVLVKPPIVPNAFTPGNDGTNDFFNVILPNTNEYVLIFKVYNRWGKLVYDYDDASNGWNGGLRNDKNDPMPSGVYIYHIQYLIEDKVETVRGDVTLIR